MDVLRTNLKEQREGDPLVVLPVAARRVARPPHPWIRPCLARDGERRVDPAVRIQDVFGNVPGGGKF